jgi:signal transduction histidine kinase
MTSRLDRRTALIAAGSALLLLALAFLFVRTQATGYKDQVQALALLRELRDAVQRWDADGLRLANDLGSTQAAVPDRGPILSRIFHELAHVGGRAGLAEQVPQLRSGITDKDSAYKALRERHGRFLEAFAAARESLVALAAEAAALRARDQRTGERASALITQIEQVRSGVRSADIESVAEVSRTLELALATLPPAALAIDPKLAPAAERARDGIAATLAARADEAQAWRRFTFMTVGSRAEQLAQGLSTQIESALDDKDRWRIYLFAYAAALLVAMGYLGLRVISTQAELRRANEELEARVAERTRELEKTLAQLRESEAQLVQTEKMSSLGQLVAGVAHEINTPLAYVKNSVATVRDRMPEIRETAAHAGKLLALLGEESPDPTELQVTFDLLAGRLAQLGEHQVLEDLDSLTRDGMHGIEQISELVTNLKNFSRLDRSHVASFNVNDGVVAALLIAKPTLRKVDVDKRLADVPSITCSPSQVNQVLLNIVTNAAQSIDKPRGNIRIATRTDGPDHVAIEIADNGKGIPPESIGRIFDPFFTTKAPGQGTGLGLSIAYKIVTQHGGRIDVKSEVGVGSTFTVILPIRPAAQVAAAALAEASRAQVAA